jgi:26S proteasome regulatory subunit N8
VSLFTHVFPLAVPFEEDPKNPNTWYFDRNYHEAMFAMFKKVNASEKVLGWYSTGPRIRPADQDIHELMRKYVNNPVFVIVDVAVKDNADEIPTKAYLALRSTPEPNSKALFHFAHVPSEIGAEEAEEIGVEHLLREIKDARLSTITDVIGQRLASLRALETRMQEVYEYLDRVARGELPANPKIIYNIQNAFNLCPDVARPDLAEALTVKTNDSLMVLYIASLVRSITALHDLVKNKMMNRAAEQSERDKLALLAATQAIEEETGAAEIDADAVGDEF